MIRSTGRQRSALHIRRNWFAQDRQDRRRDVRDFRALDLVRTVGATGSSPQDDAILRVIRPVRARVIFESVELSAPDSAN